MIDGRAMLPPEPLERTLTALDLLPSGEEIVLLLYCQPHPLYQALRGNGFAWREKLLDDGTYEISIRKA